MSAGTFSTSAFPVATAEGSIFRDACVCVSRAVAVFPRPSLVTAAVPAVTRSVPSTEKPFKPHAGEVITFAVGSVYLAKLGWVAGTLPTVTVTTPTAGDVACMMLTAANFDVFLGTLAVRPKLARVANTHSTLKCAVAIAP